ncbi:hypothetical protein SAMN05660909_05659 [Chitinophaga terrae (ex Kim and Jung 2007)]|uniref:SMI1/KNR4 family protein n=1 Tax=Chitinophaga terrae (ex Kim and Jung 2007) TaxID=408074 RepID=A0A1H4GRS3_9BACT|nr:hypothetical protein [Chitinophaga terrae (ex Kim and Jung 2007)]GEP93710.1 hypothetical protein CTE07_53550 [Chitinophaga terrae (ex Kim and Jung 2007)]SEB12326.1 hypothetical protein SAMN05660909_05659 [Chitinophaga terrae (ex Kim and Jung 2007)]
MIFKDLRFGNYIIDANNEMVEYSPSIICSDEPCDIGTYFLYKQDEQLHIANLNPIVITEEWLLGLGLKKESTHPWAQPGCGSAWEIEGHKFMLTTQGQLFLINYKANKKPIEYVHQLQNLLYDLTGVELMLSENT